MGQPGVDVLLRGEFEPAAPSPGRHRGSAQLTHGCKTESASLPQFIGRLVITRLSLIAPLPNLADSFARKSPGRRLLSRHAEAGTCDVGL